MRHKGIIAVVVAVLVALAAAPASTPTLGGVTFHGFVSQGYHHGIESPRPEVS